jgi:hypothetical protein
MTTDRPMRLEQAARLYPRLDPAEVVRAFTRRPLRIDRTVHDLKREFGPQTNGFTARLAEAVACCADCEFSYDELMFAAERGWIAHAIADSRVYFTLDAIEQFRANRDMGRVYAVGFQRYVKIGFTTHVASRVSALQTGVPVKLAVYRTLAAHHSYERELHRRFAKHRMEGEWFFMGPEIRRWLKERRG